MEAIEPMRAGMENYAKQEKWKEVAITANNLSELELTLGEVAEAVGEAEQSVTYADRSSDSHQRQESRCTQADALHQAGRAAEAETRFREAEEIHAKAQPQNPLLYSIRGFKYCDLLLATPERAAWELLLGRTRRKEAQTSSAESQRPLTSSPTLIDSCRTVSQRAAQTLKIAEQHLGLLDIALDHLTLGRAALYAVILSGSKIEVPKSEIENAVRGLRRAGQQDELPKALLTYAWQRVLTGARTGPESAQEDLDEAWEIAERGPMRLFMADIHLYRARLFGGMKDENGEMKYPWDKNPNGTSRGPKDDLAAARKLIEQCGYWRRKEELEDAEAAAKNW
jgi:tetratricopeptide (TPR) repeat protein